MFLEYGWLVKHNPEVNQNTEKIWFTRCPRICRIQYQDISFQTRRIQPIDNQDRGQQKIEKELDPINPEDLPNYIQPFTHLFNKKKFKKLPERREWDHKINLIEDAPKKLNVKTSVITIKEEEALNKWLNKQLQAELIVESSSRYIALCFYIPKIDGLLQLVQDYRKLNQYMIKDKTLLLLIREVINKLKEAKYFNKLYLIWKYNNIWIKEGNKQKVAFLMNK